MLALKEVSKYGQYKKEFKYDFIKTSSKEILQLCNSISGKEDYFWGQFKGMLSQSMCFLD